MAATAPALELPARGETTAARILRVVAKSPVHLVLVIPVLALNIRRFKTEAR